MDIDVYVAEHGPEWARLEALLRRRRLSGEQADELVTLYQRAATSLSVVRTSMPDPALVASLTTLVARARARVAGASTPAWSQLARFVRLEFPAALYRTRWWWGTTAALWLLGCAALAVWVARSPSVQATIAAPEEIRRLVNHDFADYYSSHPAASFAAKVWTNNAWVAAAAVTTGVLLLPVVYVLVVNAANVAVSAGLMASAGRLGVFFGLILPHGMLELTAVFVAAGAGLRVGWSLVDPGPRSRAAALAAEGRAAIGVALGLVGVLLVSGAIEAFVTPSPLPTAARIAIGLLAEAAFLGYVFVIGRRAALAGETGDVAPDEREDVVPVAG